MKLLEKDCEKIKRVKFHKEGRSNCTLTWKDNEVKYDNVHKHVCKRTNSTKDDFSIVGIPSTAVVNDAGEAAAAPIVASSTAAISSSTNPTAAAPVASSAAAASSSTPSDAGRVAVVPQVVKVQPWLPLASLPLKLHLLLQVARKYIVGVLAEGLSELEQTNSETCLETLLQRIREAPNHMQRCAEASSLKISCSASLAKIAKVVSSILSLANSTEAAPADELLSA